MKAIYQKNYNLFFKKLTTEKSQSSIVGLDNGFWNNKTPLFPHTSYSLNQNWKRSYCSPLFHVNLHELHAPEQVNHLPFILVRDGLFLLLDFFYRFPEPKIFEPIFLVHSTFSQFIPLAWQKKVLFYDFAYKKESKVGVFKSKERQFLIKAIFNEEIVNYEEILEKIIFCSDLGNTSVALFMNENPFMYSKWQGNDLLLSFSNFMINLKNDIKHIKNVEFISYDNIYKMENISNFEFSDLNIKENYYVDEYLNFFLLKNGAVPLENDLGEILTNEGSFIRLSPVHGVFVHQSYELDRSHKWDRYISDLDLLNEKGQLREKFEVSQFLLINKYFSSDLKRVKFAIL